MNFKATILMLILLGGACGNKNTQDKKGTANQKLSIESLSEKIEKFPNNPDLYHKRAQLYLQEKILAKGMADMHKAISMDSLFAPYFLTIAELYYATGKLDSVKFAINRALALDTDNEEALAKMGQLLYYLKDYVAALKYMDKALAINRNYAMAYFYKGMILKEMGDTGLAVNSFQSAVQTNPQHVDGYIELGLIYAAQNKPMAEQYLKNAVKVGQNNTQALYALAYYYQKRKNDSLAIKYYKILTSVKPKFAPAYHNIGYIYLFHKSAPDTAILFLSKAIIAGPDYATAYYHRGLAHYAKKEIELAKKDFKKALKYNPQLKKAQIFLDKL